MSEYKPSYTFRLVDSNQKVVLTPSVMDNGKPKSLPYIELGNGRVFTPRTKEEELYLMKHPFVRGGTIKATKIVREEKPVQEPVPAATEQPTSEVNTESVTEVVEAPQSQEAEKVTTDVNDEQAADNQDIDLDAIASASEASARETLLATVTTVQAAARVLRELGYTHNMTRKSEMVEFAKTNGFSFPNWK